MNAYNAVQRIQRVRAFLALIRKCEGADYNTLFGGGTFASYADHPRQKITRSLGGRTITSSAAGAYQFLARTWDECKAACALPDFSPYSQDIAAIFLLDRREALDDVLAGDWKAAIAKTNKEWASLPGSPYGQPTRRLDDCLSYLARVCPEPMRNVSVLMAQPASAVQTAQPLAPAEAPQPTRAISSIGRLFVLPSFLRALQAGEELVNATTWKDRQALVNALTVLVISGVAIAKAYGYTVPFSDDRLTVTVAVVVGGLFNVWATLATSKRVGVPASADAAPAGTADRAGHASAAGSESGLWFDDRPGGDVPVLKDLG